MIKTYQQLLFENNNYKNPKMKITRMVEKKEIYKVAKGIYETDRNVNPYFLAEPIYSPSYISFHSALSHYNMIPDVTYAITSATFNKRKTKRFETTLGVFTYRDIPKSAYPFSFERIEKDGYAYNMATKEKALCDTVYLYRTIKSVAEMKQILLDDLRIDEEKIFSMDYYLIRDLAKLYHSVNLTFLEKYIRRIKNYDK